MLTITEALTFLSPLLATDRPAGCAVCFEPYCSHYTAVAILGSKKYLGKNVKTVRALAFRCLPCETSSRLRILISFSRAPLSLKFHHSLNNFGLRSPSQESKVCSPLVLFCFGRVRGRMMLTLTRWEVPRGALDGSRHGSGTPFPSFRSNILNS